MVGLYIAAASAVCTLAMSADFWRTSTLNKQWNPCKYFALNATSLTLLAVAMKLPMDLNTILVKSAADGSAKYVSLFFMSVAMANLMPSLGSMSDKEILANVVALAILVITITGDVVIQLAELWYLLDLAEVIWVIVVPTILMLLLLVILASSAITVPPIKRSLESKYQEKHKTALREEEVIRREAFRNDERRGHMMKYWVMAETSSPQFVIERSVVCTTSSLICLFAAVSCSNFFILREKSDHGESPYGDYTKWILCVQSIGVMVGTMAPTFRWLNVVGFNSSTTNWNRIRKRVKTEGHWIQTLVEWRDSSVLQIRQKKCRKYLHDVKWFALTFCIRAQILIVLVSKLVVLLSTVLMRPFFLCFAHIQRFIKQNIGRESGDDTDPNLSHYVLLLEGEAELPTSFLKSTCREAEGLIKTGRMKQPRSLVNLLGKFHNFNGVGQFDTNQIPSLHSQEPPNCWTLPVVTLTSIAVALPNITKHSSTRLLSNVSQGLSLAKIVEQTLNKNEHLKNIGKAADICWIEVVFYMKWLEIDLERTSLNRKNSKEVLQELSTKAEGIIIEFKEEVHDPVMENPLNWPPKVVAANSMYRISRTILLSYEEENDQTDEGLFERLSVMIADILAACLTNLPHVITTMCHSNAIEEREKSVRREFLLLGETEQVVELLQQQEWPSLDHDTAAYIEEWRALLRQNADDPMTSASTSNDETVVAPAPGSEEH